MATKLTLTHEERVKLYVKIFNEHGPKPLTEFNVALMRNAAPSQPELDALNDALKQLGWEK
jgi:hypothetical protein